MSLSSPIPEPTIDQDPTPPVTLVLTILLLSMFFIGFFSIYLCRCFMDNILNSLHNRQTPNGTPINPNPVPLGLDASIVNSFPTFPYSSVKDYRREKYGLECAICLCEFNDTDMLRLIAICCHVFHQECIDLWFETHKSCPVCRRDLEALETKQTPENIANVNATPTNVINNNNTNDNVEGNESTDQDAISITIKDDLEDHKGESHKKLPSFGKIKGQEAYINFERFSRSHSTGHSIVKKLAIEDDDKYTLRLPEHIQETITRRHNVTLSATTFGEYSSNSTKKHDCFGEISTSATCGDAKKV